MYSEQSAEDATILSDDEIVDTRNGYTYRVVAFNLEHNMFWIRYTGEREEDWSYVEHGNEEDINLRYNYAQTIAGLYSLNCQEIPENIKMYLSGVDN